MLAAMDPNLFHLDWERTYEALLVGAESDWTTMATGDSGKGNQQLGPYSTGALASHAPRQRVSY